MEIWGPAMTDIEKRKPFKVRHATISEGIASLPKISGMPSMLPPIDLFIGASGFERRVLAVPEALRKMGARISGACLLGRYRTNPDDNSARAGELVPVLEEISGKVVYFDADSPSDTKNAIDAAVNSSLCADSLHAVIDVSGASSRLIFSVMGAVLRSQRRMRLTILYTPALHYHEPEAASRDKPAFVWGDADLREFGVAEVDHNELYQGMHQDHLPAFVVAFPSMFPERLRRCLSYLGVGPLSGAEKSIHWVLPSIADEKHLWRTEQIEQCIANIFPSTQTDEGKPAISAGAYSACDVYDYIRSAEIVMNQIEQHTGSSNISMVHMGSKLQAIGAAIALAARPEVALVSARPNSFAAKTYSDGCGDICAIVLEAQKDIVEAMSKIGTLEIVSY